MIEAMACGTPVIAYKNGSVPEVLENGVTGFMVSDIKSAVDAVGRIAGRDRRLCRQQFELRFSDERMALDYLAIYKKLIRGESSTLTLDDGVLSWTDLLPNTTT
jgi:glycosyltransferase involved in cell wall biosynthesis